MLMLTGGALEGQPALANKTTEGAVLGVFEGRSVKTWVPCLVMVASGFPEFSTAF